MEIHKYERPEGVALLKQEVIKADAEAVKQRLSSAILRALQLWCSGSERAAWQSAAKTGHI
jgi:hypothetical protein